MPTMPAPVVNLWRNTKRKATGRLRDGIGATAIIEACYYKKYADVLIECSGYASECVRYVVAFNYLELKLVGEQLAPNHNLDQYDWIPKGLSPESYQQWLVDTFIKVGAEWEINVSYSLRKKALKPGVRWTRFRRLQACRDDMGKVLKGNATDGAGWQSHVAYIKQLWTMNKKLVGNTYDDVYEKVTSAIDQWVPQYR